MSAAGSPATELPDRSSSEDQFQANNPTRKSRPARACTARTSARLQAPLPALEPRSITVGVVTRREKEEQQPASRIITSLTQPPTSAQLPRWGIRSMWELASVLNFLNVFRPLLNISVEFSAEELETALLVPNNTLDDIHIPLLKAIPPVIRVALGRSTWVTVLCRKIKDWWHWVADGEIPIAASHGAEVEVYKNLEPPIRVLILKALCDIRVEQEDIRNYIDNSLKHGVHLSLFRKDRIGGDSLGVSYWYEDDEIIGHRLYREIRKVEVKKGKGKTVPAPPNTSYQWEMVASNLDEFQEVSDKLLESRNRTEVSLAKKLKIDILPEVDKIQKRKDRLLKKQHRQALLLDSFVIADGISSGRSLRDRKPVTYTFDDYDRSINEAIKITKKRQISPEQANKREPIAKPVSNGGLNGDSPTPQHAFDAQSPNPIEYEETDDEFHSSPLDRSNRRRKRPQRYSAKEFVEAVSENEAYFDSDDDIVGEAVYDDEYLRNRKQKVSSSSEGDEEYHWEDNAEDEEEYEEDDEEDSLSISEDSVEHRQHKKLRSRSRRGAKLRSVDELQNGLRRSKRSTKPRINYKQYELSDTDAESEKADNSNVSDAASDAMNDLEPSSASHGSQQDDDDDEEEDEEMNDEKIDHMQVEETTSEAPQSQQQAKAESPVHEGSVPRRRFLDLNELAPGTGFEDGPNSMKDEDDDI
ncbi:DDT domain-containing protein DDR4 [Phalaenopsis equestris]|uniref:DDT domain-containing protein DDR4 n=1 Tax=Phalaenopsis equestris TaxID=78828 RepID=UPI0009E202B1|nr:DDT domain-containing protein DDR4 [Phalaenopsis equestris]